MVQQPHFDDELTVLAARPVVPLQEIDARVKHRRRWFLGGAFAVAMFLGAASAFISAYFKFRNAPEPEIAPEIQSLSVLSVPEETPQVQDLAVFTERPKPLPRHTNYMNHPAAQPLPAIEPKLSEDEALHRIRDAVLVGQWQERRARRVERRERRRSQHHDRDLSNIDEIFEGPRHRP